MDAPPANNLPTGPEWTGDVRLLGTAFALMLIGSTAYGDPMTSAPMLGRQDFSLPIWSTGPDFVLSEQQEGILVLDFFAYWCGPCLQASRDLEMSVNRYYESRGGNRHGVPVTVVSVNVEAAHPDKTDAFIEKTGMRLVLDDSGGKLLEQFGGASLPAIVILKSFRNRTGHRWEITHQLDGYPGLETVRSIIDSLNGSEAELDGARVEKPPGYVEERVAVNQPPDPDPPIASGPTRVTDDPTPPFVPDHRDDSPSTGSVATGSTTDQRNLEYTVGFEGLSSSDIVHLTTDLLRRRAFASGYWDLWASYGRIQVDYAPVPEADVIGEETHLDEPNASIQLTRRRNRTPVLEFQVSGGGYYGFTDHASLWLNEYYRQQFSGLDGYVEAQPWGINFLTGLMWDSRSAAGILGALLILQQDDVAPGYDRLLFQPLERGRERLYTGSLLLEQESVVSRTARMRNQVQLTQTTDRGLRYRYNGNLNLALAEHWVVRLEGAVTYETVPLDDESDFLSWSGGLTAEYDWDHRWFLGFTGRKYQDNGQIEKSILVSSGPPALETTHIGLSLRHVGEASSWSISIASYRTRYDEIDSPIRPFGNLYRDRDWLSVNASFNHLF